MHIDAQAHDARQTIEDDVMNDNIRFTRQAWSRIARTATAITATAALALLTAACSGSPSSAGSASSPRTGGSSSSPSAVAYSACMRAHGVPNYPDPNSSGVLPKGDAQHFGVSSSQLQVAQSACQPVLPNTGSFDQQFQQCVSSGDCPQALVQQAMTLMRNFARCMRSSGVPNFPDPTIGHGGTPFFNASGAGITNQYTHSAGFRSEVNECSSRVGGSTGVPVLMG
jgi:hypothetical protein